MTRLRTFLSCLPCCAVLLVGCSMGPGDQAARVNGVKISREEVELVREQLDGPGDADPARQRLLDGLIVKELLAQQFLRTARGSAEVSERAVSVARRELLAQRYITDLMAAVPPPDPEHVRRFYRDHPELFAERRVFEVRTLDVALPTEREVELRQRVEKATSLEEVVAWLRSQKLGFAWSETEHTSEELSGESLAQLRKMQNKQVALLPVRQGMRVIQLLRSRPAGLDEKAATALIRDRLWTQLRASAVNEEITRLARLAAISVTDDKPAVDLGALVSERRRGSVVPLDSSQFAEVTGRVPDGGATK